MEFHRVSQFLRRRGPQCRQHHHFCVSNEVSHLGESTHYHHDNISYPWFSWESHNKVHANVTPRPCTSRKGSVKALREVARSLVINVAPFDHLMNIFSHLGRIKMFLDYLNGLINAKVIG